MTETSQANGTAPAPPAGESAPCTDCVTKGEKALAVVALLFGAFIIFMAIDIFSGGKAGGFVKDKAAAE
jgi:hypothetical protein